MRPPPASGHGLLLCTDGLVERRGVPLGEVCGKVGFEMLGADQADDDVAVLTLLRLQ